MINKKAMYKAKLNIVFKNDVFKGYGSWLQIYRFIALYKYFTEITRDLTTRFSKSTIFVQSLKMIRISSGVCIVQTYGVLEDNHFKTCAALCLLRVNS